MKVKIVFRFYLPYLLPRTDDWHGQEIALQGGAICAVIRPRAADDELFPDEIDRKLATQATRPSVSASPTGGPAVAIRNAVFDRVDVSVYAELTVEETPNDAELEVLTEAAIEACNAFLGHCRVAARSPFVTGIERFYAIDTDEYQTRTPYTAAWYDADSHEPLLVYEGDSNARASAGAFTYPERGAVSFPKIVDSLQRAHQPNLAETLLLDAHALFALLRLREGIVILGTACEIASDEYLRHIGKSGDPQADKVLGTRNTSFAERRFHLLTQHFSQGSLKNDDPGTFELVEQLYRTRNNIAHEGLLYFKDSGTPVDVDAKKAGEHLFAAERALRWLDDL